MLASVIVIGKMRSWWNNPKTWEETAQDQHERGPQTRRTERSNNALCGDGRAPRIWPKTTEEKAAHVHQLETAYRAEVAKVSLPIVVHAQAKALLPRFALEKERIALEGDQKKGGAVDG